MFTYWKHLRRNKIISEIKNLIIFISKTCAYTRKYL